MKKILSLLLLFICFKTYAQFPQKRILVNDQTIIEGGAMRPTMGIVNGVYADTTAANAGYIDYYHGAQIWTRSDRNFWLRDSVLNMWIRMAKFSELTPGYTTLSQFVDETAWRMFYINGSGDNTPFAFGTANKFLMSNGLTSAPTWETVTSGTGSNLSWDATNHEVDIDGGGTSAVIPFAGATVNGLVNTLDNQRFAGMKIFEGGIRIKAGGGGNNGRNIYMDSVAQIASITILNTITPAGGGTGAHGIQVYPTFTPNDNNQLFIGVDINGLLSAGGFTGSNFHPIRILDMQSGAGTKAVRIDPGTGFLTYADTTSGGGGNVTKVGTPANDQIAVWTGDGTVEGPTNLTYDGTAITGRWKARVDGTTSSATPTINTDNVDIYKLTAQTADITSFTTNLSGAPNDGDILEIQITGTAARAITWGASFVSSTVALPTTTVGIDTLTIIHQYYTTSSYGNNKWVCSRVY